MARRVVSKSIVVILAKLAEQAKNIRLSKPISLEELLKKKELTYNSAIRVNGKVVNKSYMLKKGDLITVVTAVEGG